MAVANPLGSHCPQGLWPAPLGWRLKRSTFLGPKSSGAFPTLEEATFWANLLKGQCGGIQFDPRYGYMLTHGHELVETGDPHNGLRAWTKGSTHKPEPAYPYQASGWKRFQRDLEQHETMGKPISALFVRLFTCRDEWIRRGKDDFADKVQELYGKKTMPTMIQRVGAGLVGILNSGKSWLAEYTRGKSVEGALISLDQPINVDWVLVGDEQTPSDLQVVDLIGFESGNETSCQSRVRPVVEVHGGDGPEEMLERIERGKAIVGAVGHRYEALLKPHQSTQFAFPPHLSEEAITTLRTLPDPADRELVDRLFRLYGLE